MNSENLIEEWALKYELTYLNIENYTGLQTLLILQIKLLILSHVLSVCQYNHLKQRKIELGSFYLLNITNTFIFIFLVIKPMLPLFVLIIIKD